MPSGARNQLLSESCLAGMSAPPRVLMPDLFNDASVEEKVNLIQEYINSFEYNYTGTPFVRLNRSKLRSLGMLHITQSTKKIICESLPIQCVEAVFLGCVLTAHLPDLLRIPLSFKSKMGGSVHRHVVLALRHDGKWGAVGISRRDTLMDKPFVFETLSDLIIEYRNAYTACHHSLVKIYLGFPFSGNCYSDVPIKWRAVNVRVLNQSISSIHKETEHFLENMEQLKANFERDCCRAAFATSVL